MYDLTNPPSTGKSFEVGVRCVLVDLCFPQVSRLSSSLSFDPGYTSWNRGLVFCLDIEQQCLAQVVLPHAHQVQPGRAQQAYLRIKSRQVLLGFWTLLKQVPSYVDGLHSIESSLLSLPQTLRFVVPSMTLHRVTAMPRTSSLLCPPGQVPSLQGLEKVLPP